MPLASRTARRPRSLLLVLGAVAIWTGSFELLPVQQGVAWAAPDGEPDAPDKNEPESTPGNSKDPSGKQAKKHFRQAQRMFAMGRFRQALGSYEKAYSLSRYPDILFNIAQCYRNLGDYQSAIVHFREYLDKKPDANNRDAVLELIAKLETEMAAADQQHDKEHKPPLDKKPPPDDRKNKQKPPPPQQSSSGSPLYKRWWFWAGVVGLAAGGGTAGYLLTRDRGVPSTTLGNIPFP